MKRQTIKQKLEKQIKAHNRKEMASQGFFNKTSHQVHKTAKTYTRKTKHKRSPDAE